MSRKPSKSLEGRKVRLSHCNDSHTKLEPGTMGVVEMVDDIGTVHVKWDDGTVLGLCWDDGDRWSVVS
jgi:hypothetical protein